VLIWDLVSEHVNKLNAGGLEDWEVVDVGFLQLRDDQLLDVLEQDVFRNVDLGRSVLVRVTCD
jgi:hypothetical protein